LAEDILPPAPPGEQKPVLKEKKKGFLAGLFGKKQVEGQKEKLPEPKPALNPAPTGATGSEHSIPENINLEDIRKQLGLENKFSAEEIPEPPQMPQTSTEQNKKEEFDLPDIEAAIASSKVEQPIVFEEESIEEPTKIMPMEAKAEPKRKDKKQAEKTKSKKDANDWTQDVEEKELPKEESDFSKDLNNEKSVKDLIKEYNEADKKEFLQEVKLEDADRTIRDIKRKKFEEKKGIKYEPEVSMPKAEQKVEKKKKEKDEVNNDFIMDAAPEEEIKNIKNRLLHGIDEEKAPGKDEFVEIKPSPLIQKEEKEANGNGMRQEPELPDIADERHIGGKLSSLESEPTEGELQEPAEIPVETRKAIEKPSFIETMTEPQKEEPVYTSEIIKEMEKNLVEKISAEEKARVEKEFEQEKTAFEKQKQALEQEKIVVAGKASRYEFKEKQLKRDKLELDSEKEKLKRDKEEADELMKKLPMMRKDYEKLSEKMNELYETLKDLTKKEAELRELENKIEINNQALARAQQRLEETELRIKEKGFSQYLETELREQPLVNPKLEEEQEITRASNLEIYSLIDECKAKVREKNLSEAKKLYMKVREAYNTISIKGTEKDLLYTAVRELYDDIKLAEMENNDFRF
jgi:hypothetical protein